MKRSILMICLLALVAIPEVEARRREPGSCKSSCCGSSSSCCGSSSKRNEKRGHHNKKRGHEKKGKRGNCNTCNKSKKACCCGCR